MSIESTLTRKKTTGEPGNGGEFGTHTRAAADIELDVRQGDTFAPLSAEESLVFVEDALIHVDRELEAEADRPFTPEGNIAAGRAHAHAEILALTLGLGGDNGPERGAEELIEQRKRGIDIEDKDNWDGPGELDAVRRQQIVTQLRTRAEAMDDAASASSDVSVQAYYFARSEVFTEASLDLSANSAYFTGE